MGGIQHRGESDLGGRRSDRKGRGSTTNTIPTTTRLQTYLTATADDPDEGFVVSSNAFDGVLEALGEEHGATLDAGGDGSQCPLVVARRLAVYRVDDVALTDLQKRVVSLRDGYEQD